MTRFTLAGRLAAGLFLAVLSFGCGEEDPAAREIFTARLRGGGVVPPVATLSTGSAYIDIDRLRTTASEPHSHIKVEVSNVLGVTSVGLEIGPAGQPGVPWVQLFDLQPPRDAAGPGGSIGFTAALSLGPGSTLNGVPYDEFIRRLRNGELALTVGTTGHPQGEMRGQFE